MSRLASIRSGPMFHQEVANWHQGRTGSDVVTTAMADYLAATGQMSERDAARIASGRLSEEGRNQVFNRASAGRPLTTVRSGRPPVFVEKAAGLAAYVRGNAENQPLDTTNTHADAPSSLGESNLSGSSLGGSGLS